MDRGADSALEFTRRFARTLAHDANNLTGAILVLSELLQMADSGNQARVRDLAQKIRKACWQLQIRINQPVALDHLVWAGRGRVSVERLQAMAHDLVASLVPKKVSARIEVSAADISIEGTELLLAIAMFNLLRNAVDALGETGGEINIRLVRHDPAHETEGKILLQHGTLAGERRYLRLTIEDSGPGFTTETAEIAFLPFYTSDETGRKLGLGLHFVETLIDGLGGVITLRQVPATCFDIFLPIAEIRNAEPSEPANDLIPVLRHVAVVSADSAWAGRFTTLATAMGARVSVFNEPAVVDPQSDTERSFSALVLVGEGALSPALIEEMQQMRVPCIAIADTTSPAARTRIGDIRPMNLIDPSDASPAETLHRLLAHGAIQ